MITGGAITGSVLSTGEVNGNLNNTDATLPIATKNTLGGIKVGETLKVGIDGILNTTEYTADNVSMLKIKECEVGDVVKTLGYYKINDGGGALYLIREKTEDDVEDGGSIHFVGDNLVAELITNNEINIKQFGAKGDGVNDDTIYFKNAIEYVKELKKKSYCLNINPGIYSISSTIDLPMYIKLSTMGNVQINYNGEDTLLHLYNTSDMSDMYEDLNQNPYNIGDVIDGSKGVLILKGLGKNNSQIALKMGEETEGVLHRTSSAWCNLRNVYIEKFEKGFYFTNYQNFIMRFYNVTISNCGIAVVNSDLNVVNSGELVTFNMCSINNNDLAVQVNNIMNFNFINTSIDYNKNGIELNWMGYYTLNLSNCWLEANNEYLSNEGFLIKSNVPSVPELNSYSLPIVNITNCLIYPNKKCAWTIFKGKMKLNLNNITVQCNLFDYNNPEGQFLCDDEVVINSSNPIAFIENTMLLNKGSIINKNFDFSDELNGYDFSSNTWGNKYEISTDKFFTGTQSLKVIAGESKYINFETEKFNVSKIKKIIGNILFLIDSENETNQINTTITLKFFDKDGVELTDKEIVLNRDYTKYEPQKFVLIPASISLANGFIDVPNEAIEMSVKIIMGNLNKDVYIDNIAITGLIN